MAQLATASIAPAPNSAVGGDGEIVRESCRHSDYALARQGFDLLGLPLVLHVAVSQIAQPATAPGPNGAIRGESEAEVS